MMRRVRTTGEHAAVAEEVSAHFERILAEVDQMRAALCERFAAGPVDAAQAEAAVHPIAQRLLDGGAVLGTGYVAGRDALSDRALHLASWQGEDKQLLGRSDAPGGDEFDYTKREWFRVPQTTGDRHVTGPYVDYVCADEYVVTSAVPVLVEGGRMVGIVGADQLVETLEDLLLEVLSDAGATLVSDHGRVIASADHRVAPGTLVELGPQAVPCGTLPMAIISARLG